MSEKFEWQTEEDDAVWEATPVVEETPIPPRRPWFTIGLILVALLVAGGVIWREVDRRLEETTETVEADVLAAHNLIRYAVEREDLDLFHTMLSGRDPEWTTTEEALLQEGWVFDRAPLGLPLVYDALPASPEENALRREDVTITLSPDFTAAEVSFDQEYKVKLANIATDTVTLRQTVIYRRGSQRWLFSPPEPEFWGEWQTYEGDWLTIAYPQRDEEIVQLLATGLETAVDNMCHNVKAFDCPSDLHMELRLDSDPATLAALDLPAGLNADQPFNELALPAPTLLGIPSDETGMQALTAAYVRTLASALIAHEAEWECCRRAGIFQVLVDYQLSQLGYLTWPVNAADYQRVLEESVSLSSDFGQRFWYQLETDDLYGPDGWQLYTAVDFLVHYFPQASPETMIREIAARQNFATWLQRLSREPADRESLLRMIEGEWRFYAYNQMSVSQESPPVSLPQQDLQLLCTSLSAQQVLEETTLYRYSLDAQSWSEEHVNEGLGFAFIDPLPGDDVLVYQSTTFEDESWRTFLWQDGGGRLAFAEETFSLSLGQTDPAGKRLLIYVFDEQVSETPVPMLVNLEQCDANGCEREPLSALPVWSPDGNNTILVEYATLEQSLLFDNERVTLFAEFGEQVWQLFRGDSDGRPLLQNGEPQALDMGYAPFWLDNETYGYIRFTPTSSEEAVPEVVTASIADGELQPLLDREDLLAILPPEERPPNLLLHHVAVNPADAGTVFVVALHNRNRAHELLLFSFDVALRTVDLRMRFPLDEEIFSLGFSPDGRYLLLTATENQPGRGPGPDDRRTIIYLHDIAQNQTTDYVAIAPSFLPSTLYDWSADGQWLAVITDDKILNVIAPDHDYQHVVWHDLGMCSSIAWINP